ncbi:MAG: hypothetical protein AAF688_12965 [Bacteroidota bacterium]
MEKEKLYMNQLTRQKLYKLFGIKRVQTLASLDNWLERGKATSLNEKELLIAKTFQEILIKNIEDWTENELSLGFIGPILNMIDFKIPYQLNFFTQRPLAATVGDYEIIGKPDGLVAGGSAEPEAPYFNFHEYKRDVDSSGDPAGQNLAAMLVGQALNEKEDLIYGCYVVGRNWYFMVLQGKEFTISKDYSAVHDDDLQVIVQTLKALRQILVDKLAVI